MSPFERTTRVQFQKMIEMLEKEPDIARSIKKVSINDFWKEFADNLNCLGPPIRESASWKRVWLDYKWGLKQKLRKQYCTGRKSQPVRPLSKLEERAVKLLGLRRPAVVQEIETVNIPLEDPLECLTNLKNEESDDIEIEEPSILDHTTYLDTQPNRKKVSNTKLVLEQNKELIEVTKLKLQSERRLIEELQKATAANQRVAYEMQKNNLMLSKLMQLLLKKNNIKQ